MTTNTLRIAAAVAAGLLAYASASRSARADEAESEFQAGNRALEAGRWQEAEGHYEVAFKLRPGADIATNLAQAEIELGKKTEAADHLSYALRTRPASTRREQLAAMESMLASVRGSVCAITIETNVAGADVVVDERNIGRSPLADPVFVAPGKHKVHATLKAEPSAEQTVDATAGGTVSVKLVLRTNGGSTSKPMWPLGVLLGVSGAGLALGIVGVVLNQQRMRDAEDAGAELPPQACGSDGEACPTLVDSYSEANAFLAMGIAGFAIAGAAGIAALIYGLVPASSSETDTRARGVALVRRVLESLPPKDRECIQLVFFEELTQKEAAKRLGITSKTVYRAIERTKEALRKALRRDASDAEWKAPQ